MECIRVFWTAKLHAPVLEHKPLMPFVARQLR